MRSHDHQACIRRALAAADARGAAKEFNVTPVRRRVLEILLEQHVAVSAYALLQRCAASGFGAQPPVAYRALEFWMGHGFVHKIEHLNAYVACSYPHLAHQPAFLICRSCKQVDEVDPGGSARLSSKAKRRGFSLERTVIEAVGVCTACRRRQ